MTSTNPTGPSPFGRWQEHAASIEAGLLLSDPYPLEKILFCATCNQPFFGEHEADTRVYRTYCHHRPGPLPANEVEHRVYAETHAAAFGTDTVTGLTNTHYAVLAVRFFTRIELGSTTNEINFTDRV